MLQTAALELQWIWNTQKARHRPSAAASCCSCSAHFVSAQALRAQGIPFSIGSRTDEHPVTLSKKGDCSLSTSYITYYPNSIRWIHIHACDIKGAEPNGMSSAAPSTGPGSSYRSQRKVIISAPQDTPATCMALRPQDQRLHRPCTRLCGDDPSQNIHSLAPQRLDHPPWRDWDPALRACC